MAKKPSKPDPSKRETNPYASPESTSSAAPPPPAPSAPAAPTTAATALSARFPGIWRNGDVLIMEKKARLPNRCIKSNDREGLRSLTRRHTWYHWGLFFLFLLSPVLLTWDVWARVMPGRIGVVLGRAEPFPSLLATIAVFGLAVLLFGRSVDMTIALNGHWRKRRTLRILVMVLLIFDMIYIGYMAVPLLPFLLLVAAIAAGVWAGRIGAPSRITRTHVYFRGVHPDFLAMFPQWPGPS